jgi:hypothetical protein
MAVTTDSSEASPSNDKLMKEWEEFRSRLHESGHRFNSRYAQRMRSGRNISPQAYVQHLAKMYERTAAMTVKTVTDHASALGCVKELDIYLKKSLKLSSQLLREALPRESRNSVRALTFELHRRLLPRSEHWKAEAHNAARLAERAKDKAWNQQRVSSGDHSKDPHESGLSVPPKGNSVAQQILRSAMERHGLNPPKLAVRIRAILKRKGHNKPKVDRSTTYRILSGQTKRPNPAIKNGLIEALQLEGEDAEIVRLRLGGPSTSTNSRKR